MFIGYGLGIEPLMFVASGVFGSSDAVARTLVVAVEMKDLQDHISGALASTFLSARLPLRSLIFKYVLSQSHYYIQSIEFFNRSARSLHWFSS